MTTAHRRPVPVSRTGTHRGLSALGAILVSVPLIGGLVTALLALSGRLDGPETALTTLWRVPLTIAWLAVPGAAILLLVHRHRRLLIRTLAFWSAVAAAGWLVTLGAAEVSGLADATTNAGIAGRISLMAIGISAFAIGLSVVAVIGVRASSPPNDDFY